jgi:hypothetical protein
VNGVPPVSIITDGDMGMKIAIEAVFLLLFTNGVFSTLRRRPARK